MGCTTARCLEPRCEGMEHIVQLYTAIERCNFGEARQLILDGANVNCMNYLGGTPLIETCRSSLSHGKERERESFVRFLISNGSKVDLSDIFGRTAVLYATENGHHTIVNLLETQNRGKAGKYI